MSNLNFVGSPDFVPPTGARHSSNGTRRSRRSSAATSLDARLPIIEEDHPSPPLPIEAPPRTHNRPFSQRFRSNPPRYSDKNGPPSYTFLDVIGPKGETFEDLRNNKFIARRGGWKKLCIIGFLIVLIVIGLAVGLAVGLTQRMNRRYALNCIFVTLRLPLTDFFLPAAHLQHPQIAPCQPTEQRPKAPSRSAPGPSQPSSQQFRRIVHRIRIPGLVTPYKPTLNRLLGLKPSSTGSSPMPPQPEIIFPYPPPTTLSPSHSQIPASR